MNFLISLEEIFIFIVTVLKFGELLRGWKLATSAKFNTVSQKLCLLGQKTWGLNTTITMQRG